MIEDCRFCSLPNLAEASWNRPVLETDNFLVVPTKGALVPGWTLLVPRAHVLSFAELGAHTEEIESALRRINRHTTRAFGQPTLFEHGAVSRNSNFGCGIDHAHLHIAPLGFDLLEASTLVEVLDWVIDVAPWLRRSDDAYVTMQLPGRETWLRSNPAGVKSQFFRRAIAKALGKTQHHYDEVPAGDLADLTWNQLSSAANQ